MRKLNDGEIATPGEQAEAPKANAPAFDPKDYNLELDKVKGGYGYGGYGGGYGGGGWGGGYSGGGYSGGWGSYASTGGGWSNW
jgi:hypothetical protein